MEDKEELFNNSLINTNKILDDKCRGSICRIEYDDEENEQICGTGFFCNIDFIDNIPMHVLITCEHVLNNDFFKKYTDLCVTYFKGKEKFTSIITLQNKRIFRDKDSDMVIIEINEKDEDLDKFSFLEIDNSINLNNPLLKDKKVYLYHFPNGDENVFYSQGYIINMSATNNFFFTNFSTLPGSSGAPIIDYENYRVIGIHKSKAKYNYQYDNNPGLGILVKYGIQKFINQEKIKNIPYHDLYSNLNTIDITYIIPKENKEKTKKGDKKQKKVDTIQLFGKEFVENNYDKYKIIYKDIEEPLKQYHKLTNEDKKGSYLKIRLTGINSVKDMKNMFRFCVYLIDLPDIWRINTSKVVDMSRMFEGCYCLIKLPDLSRWNVENVTNMRGMFYDCPNIKSIPGIENWNPIKLKECYEMFCGCASLKNSEVAKIENWKNVDKKIKMKATVGYEYGKKLNKIPHSIDLICQYIENLINKNKNNNY